MADRAVILLSGGLDSATCLALARSQGLRCHCLSVDYGQRHDVELQAAGKVFKALGGEEHRTVKIDLRAIGGSALTDDIAVPKGGTEGIPATYVPARNTVFLSLALGYAETLDASEIWVGVNAVDYSGYPDCRPAFVEAFQSLADVATKAGVEGHGPKVVAPLIHLTKPQIIQKGLDHGLDYGLTTSCYDPNSDGRACGECDSCLIRQCAFAELGMTDPALS